MFFKIDFFAISKVLVGLSSNFRTVMIIPERVILAAFRKFWEFMVGIVYSVGFGHRNR